MINIITNHLIDFISNDLIIIDINTTKLTQIDI